MTKSHKICRKTWRDFIDVVANNRTERQTVMCREISKNRRLILMWMLSKEELASNELADRVGSSQRNIAYYLRQREKSGMVAARRAGSKVYYHAVDHECHRRSLAITGACD